MNDESIQPERKKRGRQPVDLRGKQYGWLVPLYPIPREPGHRGQTQWMCVCTASHQAMGDRERMVKVRYSALVEGMQRSCGCRQRQARMFSDAGNRIIASECNVTKNEFIAFGVKPAPEWAKTREEVERAAFAGIVSDDELDALDAAIFGAPQTNSEG